MAGVFSPGGVDYNNTAANIVRSNPKVNTRAKEIIPKGD